MQQSRWSRLNASAADIDRCWQAFLRRFDIEHTFRLFKQTLGWTAPKLRNPEAADRWTWLVIACHTQLRLARHLASDLPPREDPFSSRSTKTLPAWPRAATGLEEPPPRHTP
jgi:hypothetical protein